MGVSAWHALLADGQWPLALLYGVASGATATLLALGLCLWLLGHAFGQPAWARAQGLLPAMLALPHAAFAIGLLALIAPAGWLMRVLALATGWTEPPPWPTAQDPWALGLTLVLVLKETPFLLWACASQLRRDDTGPRLLRELQLAHSMGHSRASAWWRVAVPQLLPRLQWPLLAVLAYGLTVVDVAQIIGPGAPPTLSLLAWQWLQSPEPAEIAQGTAAGWLLTLVLALLAGLVWAGTRAGWPRWLRRWWSQGARTATTHALAPPRAALRWLWLPYLAVALALVLASVTGWWRYPALWPQVWTLDAWATVGASPTVLWATLSLGLAASLLCLLLAVAWLELLPARWDRRLRPALLAPLVLPAVLWVVGMHRVALALGLDNRWSGVLLAHCVAVAPYTLIALSPAYLGFDPRLWHSASSLGVGRWRFLLRVKWPLLRAALASALAVGFAVSVAQYLPTLYLGGGRIATVTTEAVTLASGGQRALGAAHAALQWLLPALGFALAVLLGRPRWRAA